MWPSFPVNSDPEPVPLPLPVPNIGDLPDQVAPDTSAPDPLPSGVPDPVSPAPAVAEIPELVINPPSVSELDNPPDPAVPGRVNVLGPDTV